MYNLNMRVLHSGSALAFQAKGAGSIPATRLIVSTTYKNIFYRTVRFL